eukprot:TRINITY_DN2595_c0_g1_i1.p1 TRINITY_DN2595_c0_g1~~TRINITY_DN2595_c0_g1_i1.p1  ORF type:complete len:3301 (-),score=452.63 TRINITY_DN2595_c0_g1_i1:143-9151(-)
MSMSSTASERGVGNGETYLDGPFTTVQVLIADIIADLCDQYPETVGPHIWRMCKGFLEDASNWYVCIIAMELLTVMSSRFVEWLALKTDATTSLIGMLVEAQQLLSTQRDSALAASGRVPQPLQPPRQWPPPRDAGGRLVSRVSADWPSASQSFLEQNQDRRPPVAVSGLPPPIPQPHQVPVDIEEENVSPAVRSNTLDPWVARGQIPVAPCSSSSKRAPSFDNFDGPQAEVYRDGGSSSRRNSADKIDVQGDASSSLSINPDNAAASGGRCTAPPRPTKVPPLNLGLASRQPSQAAGSVSPAGALVPQEQTPAATSMTRSSRRLRTLDKGISSSVGSTAGGGLDSSSRSSAAGSSLFSSALHSLSAPLLGFRFLSGCTLSPTNSPTTVVQQPSGSYKPATNPSCSSSERHAMQQADEMAKALGEATLLADLSCILKYTQERQVLDAIMHSLRPPSKETATPRTATSDSAPVGGSVGVGVAAATKTSASSGAPSTASGFHPRGGSVMSSVAGHGPAPSPREVRAHRLSLRRVRSHTASILGRLASCGPHAVQLLGPHVPTNRLFEMLQASCSRSGACSFSFENDGVEGDELTPLVSGSPAPCNLAEGRSPARDALRLSSDRLQRYIRLSDQLRRNATVRRCVCGAASASRGGDEICNCVDDFMASCIWRLLGAHAMSVEDRCMKRSLVNGVQSRDVWDSPNAWQIRANLDSFLTRLSRALAQTLLQLKSAQGATTAGPEAVASLQYRLAYLLRLSSNYVRRCRGSALPLQAFEVLRPVLMSLKQHLCSTTDTACKAFLPPAALRLWVAYLQIAGVLLHAFSRDGGLHRMVAIEAIILHFLDFPPSPASMLTANSSVSARSAQPSGRASTPPSPFSRGQQHASGHQTPTGSAVGDPRRLPKSHSLRGLHSGTGGSSSVGASQKIPTSASVANIPSPASGVTTPGTPNAVAKSGAAVPRSVSSLLPRILERALCEAGVEETSAKTRPGNNDDTIDTLRCRILGFVEALLHVGRMAPTGVNRDVGGDDSDFGVGRRGTSSQVATPTCLRRPEHLMADQFRQGVISVHGDMKARSQASAEATFLAVLEWLQFLFLPPQGLLCRLARKLPLVGGQLVVPMVTCEKALFQAVSIADTVYIREAFVVEYYIRRHFINFVWLYNNRSVEGVSDAQVLQLCTLHLDTLLAFASLRKGHELLRGVFHRLSVLDFLAGEIDLEHETTQMRERFLRATGRPVRMVSSGSSVGSCASSPSTVAVGTVATIGSIHSASTSSQTPAQPIAPSVQTSFLGRSSDSQGVFSGRESLSQHDTSIVPLQLPQKPRPVPKLQFKGIRPSLQGCSGLGAPPPEEPSWATSQPTVNPPASAPLASVLPTVPKLSLGLGENARSAGVPVLAPVNEPGGSGTGSTAASPRSCTAKVGDVSSSAPGEQQGIEEAPARRNPPVIPRLSMPALGHPSGSAAASLDAVEQSPATSRSSAIATPVHVAASGSAALEPARAGDSLRMLAAASLEPAFQPEGTPSSSSDASSPRDRTGDTNLALPIPSLQPLARKPVPKLQFFGLRPSLQGCSGLGAPPPEEPTVEMGGTAPPNFGSGAGSIETRQASFPLSPPPPSNYDSSDDSSDEETETVAAAGHAATEEPAMQSGENADCLAKEKVGKQACASARSSHSSSSDDMVGDPALTGFEPSPDGREPWCVEADVRVGSSGIPELPPGPQISSDTPAQRPGLAMRVLAGQPGLPPRTPLLGPGPSGCGAAAAVPKLSFKGVRPSLQGSAGIGAPPPEEPGQEGQNPLVMPQGAVGVAPNVQTQAALSASAAPLGLAGLAGAASGGGVSPLTATASERRAEPAQELSCAGVIHENMYYFRYRQRRRIYDDIQLHSLVLTLILALIATPKKGLLDTRYCDQYPLQKHKRNIPFLLSLHLNHSANRNVLPWLSQHVEKISGLGGLRLLKLLCRTMMHRWMYTGWNRVAGGQFGTVYTCSVPLGERLTVAVKQIPKQMNIQDRCVFFDVFSEVSCLDAARFENSVCQLYDYGVDENSYWIVMKFYATTLKKWRESLDGTMSENLPLLMAVFREILKALYTLHWHGIVHYDLKCDNVMIDFDRGGVGVADQHCSAGSICGGPPLPRVLLREVWPRSDGGVPDNTDCRTSSAAGMEEPGDAAAVSSWGRPVLREEDEDTEEREKARAADTSALATSAAKAAGVAPATSPAESGTDEAIPCIALADFGESRMFTSMDELDTRNRGTELIKCPEMLVIESFGKREGSRFDRRKRVGTDHSADIWSLGCLLFELLTGRFLFGDEDIGSFWARVTGNMDASSDSDIVSEANCRRLEGNAAVIELIRYMLVRNPMHRPTIEAVLARFEATLPEALRAGEAAAAPRRHGARAPSVGAEPSGGCTPDSPSSAARSVDGSSTGGGAASSLYGAERGRNGRPLVGLSAAAGEGEGCLVTVLKDLSVVELGDFDSGAMDAVVPSAVDALGIAVGNEWAPRSPSLTQLAQGTWTHIVDFRAPGARSLAALLKQRGGAENILRVPWTSSHRNPEELIQFMPSILNFLRYAAIVRGTVLLVDGHPETAQERLDEAGEVGGRAVGGSLDTDGASTAVDPVAGGTLSSRDLNASATADCTQDELSARTIGAGASPATGVSVSMMSTGSAASEAILPPVGSVGGGAVVAGGGRGGLAMAAVLAIVGETYRLPAFHAFSFLSSQLLVAAIRRDAAATVASWQEAVRLSAWRRSESMLRVACLCGACSWHVPFDWLQDAVWQQQRSSDVACAPGSSSTCSSLGPSPHPGVSHCRCSTCASTADVADGGVQAPRVTAPSNVPRCPGGGSCESYARWVAARFGLQLPAVHWLWFPEGVTAAEFADGPERGELTEGLAACAEPVGTTASCVAASAGSQVPSQQARVQRFRCRWCQVLTHAEVSSTAASSESSEPAGVATSSRVALVLSYERLRLAADRGGAEIYRCRPPAQMHETSLDEAILPCAQPRLRAALRAASAAAAGVKPAVLAAA